MIIDACAILQLPSIGFHCSLAVMRSSGHWARRITARLLCSAAPSTVRSLSTRTAAPSSAIAAALADQLAAPHVIEHLQRFGFCIIDRALSGVTGPAAAASTAAAAADPPGGADRSDPCASELSARMRSEILQLRSRSLMRPNHTHLVQGGSRSFVPKSAILEADFAARPELMTNDTGADALPVESRRFWHDLAHSPLAIDALNSRLGSRCTIASQTVKAQVNEGDSGCFPLHFDTDPRVDSRKLTGVLYLNPSWSSATDGGALRLYPFPHSAIDVSPIDERLVLFDSSRMLHRVLPSKLRRVCISVWWWQEQRQRQEQQQQRNERDAFTTPFAVQQAATLRHLLPDATPSQLQCLSHLLSPSYYPHFAKLAMQHEWFQSVEQSHPDSHERQLMLFNHLDECDMIERALTPLLKQLGEANKAGDAADDMSQAWRNRLPLPWPVPPILPPHCNLVDSPSSVATPAATAAAAPPADISTADMRLIEWLS